MTAADKPFVYNPDFFVALDNETIIYVKDLVAALEYCRAELEAEKESSQNWYKIAQDLNSRLVDEKARSAKLVEALRFYANFDRWEWTTHESTRDGIGLGDFGSYMTNIGPTQIGGKTAREAIAEYEAGK